jgi:hypothetical protein
MNRVLPASASRTLFERRDRLAACLPTKSLATLLAHSERESLGPANRRAEGGVGALCTSGGEDNPWW